MKTELGLVVSVHYATPKSPSPAHQSASPNIPTHPRFPTTQPNKSTAKSALSFDPHSKHNHPHAYPQAAAPPPLLPQPIPQGYPPAQSARHPTADPSLAGRGGCLAAGLLAGAWWSRGGGLGWGADVVFGGGGPWLWGGGGRGGGLVGRLSVWRGRAATWLWVVQTLGTVSSARGVFARSFLPLRLFFDLGISSRRSHAREKFSSRNPNPVHAWRWAHTMGVQLPLENGLDCLRRSRESRLTQKK